MSHLQQIAKRGRKRIALPPIDDLVSLYRMMLRIRHFEEAGLRRLVPGTIAEEEIT